MHPADDTRIAEARQRLADCPADPQIATLPRDQLAQLVVRLHGAAQLLNAHIRDTQTRPAPGRAVWPHAALTLDRDQAATVLAALDDAAALRREAASYCPDCTRSPAGLCPGHEGSLDAADSYDALRWQLQPAPGAGPPARQQPATEPGPDGEPGQRPHPHNQPQATAMTCPECGEPAACRGPAGPVPWEAHGMTRPQSSHTDGSALCPVPGPSGGNRPAQPQPLPGTRVAVTTTEPERATPARDWQAEAG
jgi:hypothetical protein